MNVLLELTDEQTRMLDNIAGDLHMEKEALLRILMSSLIDWMCIHAKELPRNPEALQGVLLESCHNNAEYKRRIELIMAEMAGIRQQMETVLKNLPGHV